MNALGELKQLRHRVTVLNEDGTLHEPLDVRVMQYWERAKAAVQQVVAKRKRPVVRMGEASLQDGICLYARRVGYAEGRALFFYCDNVERDCAYKERNATMCTNPSGGYSPLYSLKVQR